MLKIVDVSSWQNTDSYNLGEFDGLIAKATEGCGYVDPMCDVHYQNAKNNGKLLGVYHFARPDLGNSGEAEADWFVNNIQGYINHAILVLDYEVAPYSDDWAYSFMKRVHDRTGVWPLLYASASKINEFNWSKTAQNCGLWIAGYPNAYNVPNPPVPSVNDMPYGIGCWPFWAIWQYSSSAGTLDRNIANMDAAAWQKYAKSSDTPAPSPSPDPTPSPAPQPSNYIIYTVKPGDTLSGIAAKYGTTYQKISADNGISNPDVIHPGEQFKIYTNSGGSSSNTTYTVKSGDTLSSIAAQFGTTWQKIYNDNRDKISNPDVIYPGQQLVIK